MNIKRNILFFIDKEGTKEKGYKSDGKLRVRIRYQLGKVDFNLGYRVFLSKWITESQRCKPGTTHGKKRISASEINREIQRIENLINDVFKFFETENRIPSLNEFRDYFSSENGKYLDQFVLDKDRGKLNNRKRIVDPSVKECLNEFITECGYKNDWAYATYQKFDTLNKHLYSFKHDISFSDFHEQGLNDYVCYLREKKGLRNSTILKQIGLLKWFLKWAFNKSYLRDDSIMSFNPRLKTIPPKVIFLTWSELAKLKAVNIPEKKNYLERVRDVFLFQCFTSLRYSDVFNLKRSDIKNNIIEVTTVKTADSLRIELNDHSRAILEKYKNIHFKNSKALPVISNQKMNDYLKELGELAGIDEPIRETFYKGNERIDIVTPKYALLGTHAGRRTFICNALALGIPPHIVMKWTGHSDYKAMKPYIDIADDIRANAMDKFNQL